MRTKKPTWQKNVIRALACSCLLTAFTFPTASAAPARFPNMHGSVLAGALLNRGINSYKAGHYEAALHDVMIKNDDGTEVPMDQPYFESEQILPDTWKIRNDGDYCYLLANHADLNISLKDFAENMEHLHTVRQDFDQIYAGTGEKSGDVFDHYYAAAEYGISPDFQAEPVTKAAGGRKNQQQTTADGKPLYERGRVRPGDETRNAPETIPTGQRMTYTVDGFPVTYIDTTTAAQ